MKSRYAEQQSPSKTSKAEPDLQVLELAKRCNTNWTMLIMALVILGLSTCRDMPHSGESPWHPFLHSCAFNAAM